MSSACGMLERRLPIAWALCFERDAMRLWSIHPEYLDSKGLVALWREALLAQKVLEGRTKGYTKHPQLVRFRNTSNQLGAIASYLRHVALEAEKRGYTFDKQKIPNKRFLTKIPVTDGQLKYEYQHLLGKLKERDPERFVYQNQISTIEAHPLFEVHAGSIEKWEVLQ
jgi:hypothetical protein